MLDAKIVKGVTVETQNKTGIAAKLTGLISEKAGSSIQTGWATGVNGTGHFTLLTDNNKKVIEALKGDFPKVTETDLLVITAADKAGEVAKVTETISKAGLNIDTLQATYLNKKPVIILTTDDNKKALSLFS